jgi:ATP-dependent DNA helicase RecQ
VARAKGAAGLLVVASMLAGERTARVVRAGFHRLSTFGVLRGRTPEQALIVLRVLLANAWIDLTPGDYPVPLITKLGWQVMRGEQPIQVRLPVVLPVPSVGHPGPPRPGAVPPAPPGRARRVDEAVALGMDPALFEALRAYRATVARAKEMPPYVIAPDRTLIEIALTKPSTPDELAFLHGMGPTRVAAYGAGLLAVVQARASNPTATDRERGACPPEQAPAQA